MAEKQEVWTSVLQGKKYYGAHGPRDVLIIESSESLEGPDDIVPRRSGVLTPKDMDALDSQGIPSQFREDDASLMEERYRISKGYRVVGVERNPKSVEYISSKIVALLNNTENPGVIIHYIGPGKRHTGDWCFNDGFITFLDLMECYKKWFMGKTMELVSDCSHSGVWMTHLEDYLDSEGVQPCGHSARASGIFLYLAVSCKAHEIPHQLYFSARACNNDKNTKEITIGDITVVENQHSEAVIATSLICGADSFDDPCLLAADVTWRMRRISKRVYITAGDNKWSLFVLIDDDSVIDQVECGQANPWDYGQLIRSGGGRKPSAEDKKWINKNYCGHNYDL